MNETVEVCGYRIADYLIKKGAQHVGSKINNSGRIIYLFLYDEKFIKAFSEFQIEMKISFY